MKKGEGEGDFTVIGGQRVVDLEGFSASSHLWGEQAAAASEAGMDQSEGEAAYGVYSGELGAGDYNDDELMRGYVV